MLPESLIEPFAIDGFWWLPENTDYKVPGKLSFNPKHGMSVDLLRPLKPFERGAKYALGSFDRHPYVHGVVVDGSFVALSNVLDEGVTNMNIKAAPMMLSRLSSSGPLLVFPNMEPYTEDVWLHAVVEVTNQEAFFLTQPVSHDHSTENQNLHSLRFNELTYPLNDLDLGSFKLNVQLRHSGPFQENHQVIYKHSAAFRLQFKSPMSILAIIAEAWKLAAFMSLVTGRPQLVRRLSCWFEQEDNEHTYKLTCNPYFLGQDPDLFHPLDSYSMLFCSDDFTVNIADIITTFYSSYDKAKTALGLFMAVATKPDMYSSFSYSAYAQALEGLYNAVYGDNNYMPNAEHKKFRRELRAHYPVDLNGEYVQSLDDAIRQSNRFTLNTKLNHLLGRIDVSLMSFLTSNPEHMIRRLVGWRNAIAHGNFLPDPTEAELFSRDYYVLETIVHAVLLDLLGIDRGLVGDRLIKSKRLLFTQLSTEPKVTDVAGEQV